MTLCGVEYKQQELNCEITAKLIKCWLIVIMLWGNIAVETVYKMNLT